MKCRTPPTGPVRDRGTARWKERSQGSNAARLLYYGGSQESCQCLRDTATLSEQSRSQLQQEPLKCEQMAQENGTHISCAFDGTFPRKFTDVKTPPHDHHSSRMSATSCTATRQAQKRHKSPKAQTWNGTKNVLNVESATSQATLNCTLTT